MKHVTLDCYGANEHQLDDLKNINDCLNTLTYSLNLNPTTPPQLIPYYYGKVKDDLGISAFVFLEGGHITIHTFPLRECYFVDILCKENISLDEVVAFFKTELPYNEKTSIITISDRDEITNDILPYDSSQDFGPHLMATINASVPVSMEFFFDFLENMVTEIHMDPISRPYLLKGHTEDYDFLSGLIVIAQSHIALHYNRAKNQILADIFSCAPFDYNEVDKYFNKLGTIISNHLVARGTKHIYKVKSKIDNLDVIKSMKWQNVIKK